MQRWLNRHRATLEALDGWRRAWGKEDIGAVELWEKVAVMAFKVESTESAHHLDGVRFFDIELIFRNAK